MMQTLGQDGNTRLIDWLSSYLTVIFLSYAVRLPGIFENWQGSLYNDAEKSEE